MCCGPWGRKALGRAWQLNSNKWTPNACMGHGYSWVSWWVVRMVRKLPATWETRVQSLGQEDPLEEGMATHSSILAWRIPMDRGAWRGQSMGLQRVRHD